MALAGAGVLAACSSEPDVGTDNESILPFGSGPGGTTNVAGMGGGNSTGTSASVTGGTTSAPPSVSCLPGQGRCLGGRTAQICNSTGTGFDTTTCDGTNVCLAGACRQPSCAPKETLCSGPELHTCNEDGKSTTLSRTCDTGSSCDPSTNACKQLLCEPLVGTCYNNFATRCDAAGFAYDMSANKDCGSQRCNLGACVNPEQVTPNQVAPNPLIPSPGQSNPTPATTPTPMQGGVQAPVQTCTPGAVTCDGSNTIATCNPDGLAATFTRCANGSVCSAGGICNPVACNTQGLTSFNGGQATVYWFGQGTTGIGNVACNFGINPGNAGNGQGDSVSNIVAPTMFAAMNTTNYRGASACGACVEMSYQGRTVNVTIADECPQSSNPTCTAGHIDLSRAAWNALTNNAGGTEISGVNWRFVPCNTTGNVQFLLKKPDDAYWNEFLVVNHKYPITKAEVLMPDGRWLQANRQSYNYFRPPEGMDGGDMGTYRVRVTDINGAVIEEQLELRGGPQGGNAQFACQ
ncbi:MAG: expansin EXLX1 family cellulose-binding protein [Deltaproteobacteria bacterium]